MIADKKNSPHAPRPTSPAPRFRPGDRVWWLVSVGAVTRRHPRAALVIKAVNESCLRILTMEVEPRLTGEGLVRERRRRLRTVRARLVIAREEHDPEVDYYVGRLHLADPPKVRTLPPAQEKRFEQGAYLPTPEAIRAGCEAIRAAKKEKPEEREPWTPPVVAGMFGGRGRPDE